MTTGTVRQFPIYADDETGYGDADSIQPIEDGEGINGTVLNRPAQNLRLRSETIRGLLEDVLYLADVDRSFILAGPGGVTWPGSTTAAASGIFVLTDTLFLVPALTKGAAQTAPVPPVASQFGTLSLTRDSDSTDAILVTSALRNYQGGDKVNITVITGSVYGCVLVDESTMSIVITVTGATTLTTVINSLNALLNDNGDNVCTAALEGAAGGANIIESPQGPLWIQGNHDAEGHAITPAQIAAFFGVGGNPLAEGDTLCIQYETLIDESLATDGGRRQALPENSNTSVLAASLFNSRLSPERLVNAIPICKVINNTLCFINGWHIAAGATAVMMISGGGGSFSTAAAWADTSGIAATTLATAIAEIVTDLAATAGAARIGAAAATDLAAGTVRSQLDLLAAGWGKIARINTWSLAQTFSAANVYSVLQTFGAGIATAEADIRHAAATTTIPHFEFDALGVGTRTATALTHGSGFTVYVPLRAKVGDKLTTARVRLDDGGGASWAVNLYKLQISTQTPTLIQAATGGGGDAWWTATPASPELVVTDYTYYLECVSGGSGGSAHGAEVTFLRDT